jgi:glutamate/tyrosine decarboxylase-like PLP-dependent enzyme
MGVICFRWIGYTAGFGDAGPGPAITTTDEELDALNSKIVEEINVSGEAYLTQTKLRGQTVMRIGLGNVLTTERHLSAVWKLIQKTARSLG